LSSTLVNTFSQLYDELVEKIPPDKYQHPAPLKAHEFDHDLTTLQVRLKNNDPDTRNYRTKNLNNNGDR